MQKFSVQNDDEMRLDAYLAQEIDELSRSSIKKLIDSSSVIVNENVEKASYKLKEGDSVKVDFDIADLSEIPDISLPILYEDDDCIVIDKPSGVLTHSKGAFNPEGTVATFIRDKLTGMAGERAGIVHRLDRATSGVIICAKNPEALNWLQRQFSSRKVKKTYIAITSGIVKPKIAVIDMPIARNPRDPKTFYVTSRGKPAKTAYKVLKTTNERTMLELMPETGRTHQLRVHLKQLGFPIIGDLIYGGIEHQRMLLHAQKLEITLPNRTRMVFESKLPKQFKI